MAVQQQISAQSGVAQQETFIRYRAPMDASGWEITREPVQRRMTQSPIINLGSGGHGSCVLAGTPILMADGSTRSIETFVGGEKVRTLSGVGTVTAVERVKLGVTRRIIELARPNAESLFLSDEHALWTRNEAGGAAQEWWGTYNFSHWFWEKSIGIASQTTRDAHALRFDIPNLHATVDGWHAVQPIYHVMPIDTPLFDLIVDVGGSYIAGGFVLSSRATDADCEGVSWKAGELVAA
ncbi:hypothetical protein [Trinickia fusca]|uniref:Hint domain-containing protein n=1 Tax=Trinickia fusca TaxID=2419777 RepID=A0A494XY76_9BURK|nr:hypothetical protein [Trinickia fusca]RKP52533.1 hypothetical protein D7S89_03225 [Trinickia fusca]